MRPQIFRTIGRFFQGTGDVLGTPSGDARGHVRVPIDTMYNVEADSHFVGR